MRILSNLFKNVHLIKHQSQRYLCEKRTLNRPIILGIETSCDDTGAAVVDRDGNVLGEYIHSQQEIHLKVIKFRFSVGFVLLNLIFFQFIVWWNNSTDSPRFASSKYS